MTFKLESAIWSHDTGQQILSFDRCQLTITCMSSSKEGCYIPKLYVSVNLLARVWPHLAHLCHHCHHCSEYMSISNTASHDNQVKINSWVSFASYYMSIYIPVPPSPRNMAIRPEFSIIFWTCDVDNVASTMTCSVSRSTENDLIPLPKK